MIDHPDQLPSIFAIYANTTIAHQIFIKIDMGGHRAGVAPQTTACSNLITSTLSLESAGKVHLLGLYSHAGQSYSGSSRAAALDYLRQEFEALLVTATAVHSATPFKPLILSVGATPTTTSIRNLLIDNEDTPMAESTAISALRATIAAIRDQKCSIEIHAGVYPTLDLQQLATHALPSEGPHAMLTWSDLALTIVAEVASLYPGRGKDGSPEALLGSGSLALGREPCKAYDGWGILTPWNRPGVRMPNVGPEKHTGWQVGRISQEHGILVWNGEGTEPEKLEVGQKVRVWPNHACITGAGYGWYLVVDETREWREDEIIDVWPRWRGW
jgi:D-serine deaminase-like pyridoxal phosphate-dependent protein